MIIRIDQSELFTKDPDARFSLVYSVPKGTWTDLWRRHKLLHYTVHDLVEFCEFKYKTNITKRTMRRWLYRAEIYSMALPALKKGARAVNTEYFGNMEWFVINEIIGPSVGTGSIPKAVV